MADANALLRMKKKIEQLKSDKIRAENDRTRLMTDLKEYGLASVEEAEDKIASNKKRIATLGDKIDKSTQEVVEEHGL